MRGVFIVLVTAALAGYVAAECAGACSGHGDCSTRHDYCICWDGWMGNSCDQRVCPRALAHIDTPIGDLNYNNNLNSGGVSTLNPMQQRAGAWERHPAQLYGGQASDGSFYAHDGEAHFYTECANRGICDRATGICDCFTGYEGAACNRTSCVNGCSGHGTCQTLTDVVPSNIHYRLWETDKTQVCQCDGGYFGIDCSQKKCAKNNDPLTAFSTKLNYNYGIAERDEVQYVDIRCPYNGQMIYPTASLLYTDAQFGDTYETVKVNFGVSTSNTADTVAANFLAALKGLPNEVLSDNWNPVSGTLQKVKSVEVRQLEANSFYRIVVTFNSLLGDVPTLSGKAYFKCKGGAEVISNTQNIAVHYTGDGPLVDLEYRFTFAPPNAGITFFDSNGVLYAPAVASAAIANTAGWGVLSSAGYPQSTHKEASKVRFAFSLDEVQSSTDTAIVKVHVTPVIKGSNPTAGLVGATKTLRINAASSGTYRLSYKDVATDYITYTTSLAGTTGATSANTVGIENALNSLSSIAPGFVKVTVSSGGGSADQTYRIVFYNVDSAWNTHPIKVAAPNPFGTLSATADFVITPVATALEAYTAASLPALKSQYDGTITLGVESQPTNPGVAATPALSSYDVTYSTTCINALCTLARLKFNGETVGLVNLGLADTAAYTTVGLTLTALLSGATKGALQTVDTNLANVLHATPANAASWTRIADPINSATAAGVEFQWGLPKLPLVYTNLVDSYTAHTDAGISWTFFQDVATTVPSNVVLKVSTVTSNPDRYQWKLAGDIAWQNERSMTTTADICLAAVVSTFSPAACNSGLGTPGGAGGSQNDVWLQYVALDRDDPAHREINRLRITFGAPDNDNRVSCTAANSNSYYYFQFGTNGINDSPECSDRGVCDYSSGICKCFKGYNGIDCSAQSALAAGSSGGSVAAA